ncbi:MAG: hypothetical protein R3C52_11150 [Hyphomonadaceae bacterium]
MSFELSERERQLELAKLDTQIAALQRKRRDVAQRRHPIVAKLRESALLPNERVTRKNRRKLEIMGRIRFALEEHPNGRHGLTSAELYHAIRVGVEDLKFETLRSYLSRFKSEGRLVHVSEHQLWKLPDQRGESA